MNIFALHEPGGEHLIRDMGRSGWIVHTEALGCDPNDYSGRDYTPVARDGIQSIVRLNNGYEPGGTIPYPNQYGAFAQRCANWVLASYGASRWIIGNEPNLSVEWPGGAAGQPITPSLYAECYLYCRWAIHNIQPGAEVLVAAPGPWNNQTTYPANPAGDWVQYLADVMATLGLECDGVAIHTYTHGPDPALVTSDIRMDPPFERYHYHFRAYRDFMAVIPPGRTVYITETNENVPWTDQNTGWVQAAYAEVDLWNQDPANTPIQCLALYRWPPYDEKVIEGKNGVIEDFRAAMQHDYRV